MTKKLTNKNAHDKVSTAIKELGKYRYKPDKNNKTKLRLTGIISDIPVYVSDQVFVPYTVKEWCIERDFPIPETQEDMDKITKLYDYQVFLLNENFAKLWWSIKQEKDWIL